MNNPFDFKGCQFASLNYTNAYGEVSTYKVLLGASYENAKMNDYETLNNASFPTQNLEIARISLVNALLKNMNKKTQTNQSKGQQDAYINLHKGLRLHKESGEIKIMANLVNKSQTSEQKTLTLSNQKSGNFKKRPTVNSSQKTLDKEEVEKLLKLKQKNIVQFTLTKDCLQKAKVNGQTLTF